MMTAPVKPVDRCRICGCEGDCRLGSGDTCGWKNFRHDLCTKSSCIVAEDRAARRQNYAAYCAPALRRRQEEMNRAKKHGLKKLTKARTK